MIIQTTHNLGNNRVSNEICTETIMERMEKRRTYLKKHGIVTTINFDYNGKFYETIFRVIGL